MKCSGACSGGMLPFWNTKNDPFVFFCFFISYYFISMSPKIWQILKQEAIHLAYRPRFSEEWSITNQNQQIYSIQFNQQKLLKVPVLFGTYLTISSKLLTHCMTNLRVRSSYIAADRYIHIYLHHFLKRHEDSNHFLVQ